MLLAAGLPEDTRTRSINVRTSGNPGPAGTNGTFPPDRGQNSPLSGSVSGAAVPVGRVKSDQREWLLYSISSVRGRARFFVLFFLIPRLEGSCGDFGEAAQPGKINLSRDPEMNGSPGSLDKHPAVAPGNRVPGVEP